MSKLIKRNSRGVLAEIANNVSKESMHRTQNRMSIAIKIAECLKSLNMSQKEFASKICKSESEVSDWLSGSRNFTIDTLSDVECALNVKLLDLSVMNLKEISSEVEQKYYTNDRGCKFSTEWNTTSTSNDFDNSSDIVG